MTNDGREPIVGSVARILTSHELVINRGSDHGVIEGMLFAVYDTTSEDVVDPETKDPIGRIFRSKVVVKVRSVSRRFSMAETFKKERVNIGGKGSGLDSLAGLLIPTKWEERTQTLRTTESTWERLPESESYVKTGDPVKQVDDANHIADFEEFD
jgi:hypothetical protein